MQTDYEKYKCQRLQIIREKNEIENNNELALIQKVKNILINFFDKVHEGEMIESQQIYNFVNKTTQLNEKIFHKILLEMSKKGLLNYHCDFYFLNCENEKQKIFEYVFNSVNNINASRFCYGDEIYERMINNLSSERLTDIVKGTIETFANKERNVLDIGEFNSFFKLYAEKCKTEGYEIMGRGIIIRYLKFYFEKSKIGYVDHSYKYIRIISNAEKIIKYLKENVELEVICESSDDTENVDD